MRYLVGAHAKDNDLYPTDPEIRAVVDQMLDYDIGTLYKNISAYLVNLLRMINKYIILRF